jgi:hypothetical protein
MYLKGNVYSVVAGNATILLRALLKKINKSNKKCSRRKLYMNGILVRTYMHLCTHINRHTNTQNCTTTVCNLILRVTCDNDSCTQINVKKIYIYIYIYIYICMYVCMYIYYSCIIYLKINFFRLNLNS